MGDRLPPLRLQAHQVASLSQAAACAQALVEEDDPAEVPDVPAPTTSDSALVEALTAAEQAPSGGPSAWRIWAHTAPENRYAHGCHPPAWPDLPPADHGASTPAWARRLAAWLREAEQLADRQSGH